MSTNKTQNYNLHSWVPEDDFLRSEFNDNFTGIDAALKSLSNAIAAETTARQQAVAAEQQARQSAITAEQQARQSAVATLTTGKAELVIGSYEGGAWDTTEPNVRAIDLGFTPKAVLIIRADGRTGQSYDIAGGLMLPGCPIINNAKQTVAEIKGTGFTLYDPQYSSINNGYTYCYIAVK